MDLNIALHLQNVIHVPSPLIPYLVPLIDTRCFEARLETEVADVLKKLEDDAERA